MRRFAFAFLVLFSIVAGSSASGQRDRPPVPSFQSASSELVILPVTVVDKQGRFVVDLARDQFVVHDNGRPQQVAFFTNEDTPVSIALIVDDSGSMRGRLGLVIAAALRFARSSNPDDELFAIEFNDGVRDALGGRRLVAEDAAQLEAALRTLTPQGRTALYDALLDGLQHLSSASHARKVLVLVSDGGDNASKATLDEVLTEARRSNVTIYTIGLFADDDQDANPNALKKLATSTGGERFLPRAPAQLLAACERIAREIRTGYTIGYVPPDRDGTYHRVRVQLDRTHGRKLAVRTRPGYFASKN